MNTRHIINRANYFGSSQSINTFSSFTLKIFILIIPAILLGHLTDLFIIKLKNKKIFGYNILNYILLQTLIISITIYLITTFTYNYMNDFQNAIAESYFIVMYYGLQTNYIRMIKEYSMNTLRLS